MYKLGAPVITQEKKPTIGYNDVEIKVEIPVNTIGTVWESKRNIFKVHFPDYGVVNVNESDCLIGRWRVGMRIVTLREYGIFIDPQGILK